MNFHFVFLDSVVGLNFDFVLLNLTKHSSYLIYNVTLFFSSTVQRQYREKYGHNEVIISKSATLILIKKQILVACS